MTDNSSNTMPGQSPRTSTLARRHAGTFLAVFVLLVASLIGPRTALAADWIYTVRPGDSLWSITNDYLEGVRYFERLKAYNNLTDNSTIRVGTRLRIPVEWLKAQPAAVAVTHVRGLVEKLPLGGAGGVRLAIGDSLSIGDGIRTGENGSAVLAFADASSMYLQPNTAITFDSLGAYGETGMVDTTMRLHSGRVETEVTTARGAASRFEITTPSAVAAVRGTNFRSSFDLDESTARVEVAEGRVGVAAETDETELTEGFGLVATVGQPLPPPVALLPAPDLSGASPLLERELWQVEWPPVPGAGAYRTLVYASDDLEAPVSDVRTVEPSVEIDAPPDGDYVLRVRGIDGQGLEGLDAELSVTVDARPVPPPPLNPEENARIPGPPPLFRWAVPATTETVRIQIASDADFNDVVVDVAEIGGVSFRPDALEPGDYYWRLASRGTDGDGPFGDARELRVQAVPATPEAAPPEVAGRNARLTWGRLANAHLYEFELADNEAFEDPIIREVLDEPEFTWESPGPGTFYFRVRGVSDEGITGPYGPANRLEMPYLNVPPDWNDPLHL
ncbi:MAG: FecR domain-containing protein [Gammaproteobacteria bacterium]